MLTEPAGTAEPESPVLEAPGPESEEDSLRARALEQLDRVRDFQLHLAAYVVGMLVLTGVWVLTQYNDSGGWPERLRTGGEPGSWDPWIIYVALIWGFVVCVQGFKTYFRRPPTEREIASEVERLKRRG